MGRAPRERLVCLLDLRGLVVMSTEAADGFLGLMRVSNPRIERSPLVLLSDNPTHKLQFWRLLRETNGNARRSFERAPEA